MEESLFIDELCEKLEPHVRSAFGSLPKEDTVKYYIDRNALEEEISREESDNGVVKLLTDGIIDAFRSADPERLMEARIRIGTELIASSWYEVLRWSAKGDDAAVILRDCLLPENLGEAERPWNVNTGRIGFSQEQVEGILREFGKEEIAHSLELPYGGHISRATSGYELRWAEEK